MDSQACSPPPLAGQEPWNHQVDDDTRRAQPTPRLDLSSKSRLGHGICEQRLGRQELRLDGEVSVGGELRSGDIGFTGVVVDGLCTNEHDGAEVFGEGVERIKQGSPR